VGQSRLQFVKSTIQLKRGLLCSTKDPLRYLWKQPSQRSQEGKGMRIWALREQELAIFFKKLPNVRAIRSKVRPAGVGGVTPPNKYEIARKSVKKQAMLQENWLRYFSLPLLFC